MLGLVFSGQFAAQLVMQCQPSGSPAAFDSFQTDSQHCRRFFLLQFVIPEQINDLLFFGWQIFDQFMKIAPLLHASRVLRDLRCVECECCGAALVGAAVSGLRHVMSASSLGSIIPA